MLDAFIRWNMDRARADIKKITYWLRLDTLVGEPIGKLQINHKQTLNWLLAVQRFYPSQGLHEDLCNRLGVDNSSSEFC
ncbi:Transposase [Caenorhabditis elegans]|uniref:Transposase n=1 Tax=Caenorhabditis elegans TaxID=6239 RepID=O62407_CAEEL|nr:Transposase [Caenorhabditis elegans]CAA16295.2 Transposase [Caenorhabditis elegans]|eukprot:NP_507651.2 Uncharacterized protein CELE_Y17D7C.1 [Caenorhabditis elegans]